MRLPPLGHPLGLGRALDVYRGRTLFFQVMRFVPWKACSCIVAQYHDNLRSRGLPCSQQFRATGAGQFTKRKSLRSLTASRGRSDRSAPWRLHLAHPFLDPGARQPQSLLAHACRYGSATDRPSVPCTRTKTSAWI